MPNRLTHETSPYLLQHANNPVDWHPWGPEALDRARREDKPIFLSIGYSACHWCHVMEHESFENESIARRLNESFVCIKVDREERPDLDQIYMTAVQAMTGRGGWPMSVFLTPDLKPFYGGTYWPPTGRMGMPGFDQVIEAVQDAWQNRRPQVDQQAGELAADIERVGRMSLPPGELSPQPLVAAEAALERTFDYQHGGFGGAPKFPHPMDLRLLLRRWKRGPREPLLNIVTLTLDRMAAGGIYDQLGGGFHRYSVDDRWLVPHFEKMLYDNALLSAAYVEAFQATGRQDYERVARETFDYVLREMTSPEGGFYSTLDADSEGQEGKFYVWTPVEIEAVLGAERAKMFCRVYDVSDEGNFEGHNILNLPKTLDQCAKILGRDLGELTAELAEGRAGLLEVRNRRVWPGLDDKVLVSWNGLMIDSLAYAAGALDEPRYLNAARAAADFILDKMRKPDGRLLHGWRAGQAKFDAYLDDYTCLANALVTLYESSWEERWIDAAVELADVVLAQFEDPEPGGFFFTAADHEKLISRQKDVQDSSVPSGNSMAATLLLRLGKLCGRADYLEAAERTLKAFASLLEKHAGAAGQLLIALDFYLGPAPELVLIGPSAETSAIAADLRQRYLPNKVMACRPGTGHSQWLDGMFEGKTASDGQPTLYVCQNFACQAPVVGNAAIAAAARTL
ncbi:MAG: thioredoxin domain-containing protein [Planctomycetia bacterium 21-64-5]|nr:MAG: thioredoxin domain-containing protein [Planctomycetia bacterium 21-64-5]HQU45309.1 thioredoxin domain-containing protein [Pirellulales bacterium]